MAKQKITIYILCTIIIAVISILIIKKSMEEKEYWVDGAYPHLVNNKVKEQGYKVIGMFKLWNPRPRPITPEDADFIKSKLPEWLAKHYPNEKIDITFQQVNNQELINKLHYKFTTLDLWGAIEADFYLLTLKNNQKTINVYIGKGDTVDFDSTSPSIKTILIYPFYDEEWHSNIDEPTHYSPDMERWSSP